MITESQIYWMMRCDQLHGLATFFAVIGGIALVGTLIVVGLCIFANLPFNDKDETEATTMWVQHVMRWIVLPAAIAMLVGVFGMVFIPTTKEMALIKVAPALANSELVQTTIPNEAKEIYGLAKAALVEKLKGETK